MRSILIIFVSTFFLLLSCNKDNGDDNQPPEIANLYTVGNKFNFTDTLSRVLLQFEVTDRNRDFATKLDDSTIKILDIRSDTVYREMYIAAPELPKEVIKGDEMKVNVTVVLKGILFPPRPDSLHIMHMRDTLNISIQVFDEMKNPSNILTTEKIYISR